jgi:pseudouridine-5'-phosphate glycosidase
VLGHGRTNAEVLRGMWEDDERRVIQECVEVIEKHVGVRPTGWMGSGALESNVTPDLLSHLARASGGRTLRVNIGLIVSNARAAGAIAAVLT